MAYFVEDIPVLYSYKSVIVEQGDDYQYMLARLPEYGQLYPRTV